MVTLAGPGTISLLLAPGPGARLGVARTDGPVSGGVGDASLAWLAVEGGEGSLTVDGETTAVTGRTDVFDAPGWSALLGAGSTFAIDGDVRTTVVWRADARAVASRVIAPAEVVDEERGGGATFRRVRTYVPEGPLIVGETLAQKGLLHPNPAMWLANSLFGLIGSALLWRACKT